MLGLSLSFAWTSVVALVTHALKFNLKTNSQYIPVIGA